MFTGSAGSNGTCHRPWHVLGALPELLEDVRADAADVGVAVPRAAARRTARRPAAAWQTVSRSPSCAGHLGAVHPVLVLGGQQGALADLAVLGEPVGAGEPVEDVAVDHPGAQGPLALLAADDPGVALERLLRVGQPVAVVGVDHPVAADRPSAGSLGPKMPGRCASASVRHAQSRLRAGAVEDRAGRRAGRAPRRSGSCTAATRSSGTLGTTEWSAYSTSPARSAAVVFTHGIPAPRSCAASRSRTRRAPCPCRGTCRRCAAARRWRRASRRSWSATRASARRGRR